MDIKEKIRKVFDQLGFTSKVKDNKMDSDDWELVNQAYQKEYGVSITTEISENKQKQTQIDTDTQASILNLVNETCNKAGIDTQKIDMTSINTAFNGLSETVTAAIGTMREQIETLKKTPESDQPLNKVSVSAEKRDLPKVLGHSPHTPSHLFGIESPYFARGTWWTELVASGEPLNKVYRDEDATAFRAGFNNYIKDFQARCLELSANNQVGLLDYNKMIHGESFIDYSQMNSELGEYVVRRMDTIIAYLRTLKSVSNIFPVVSNVKHKQTAPTAHFGELSQSYLSGHAYKGDLYFGGEIYQVADVMMKFAFNDPKQLEKEYIGYKDREGSNPMKWMFFEWVIVHFGTILFNEQQRRRVLGCQTPRQGNFPLPALLSADGSLRAIERVEEENKVLPFKDLKIYDEASILPYVKTFWSKVVAILPNMEGMKLYINEKHQLWYIDAYDEKYGKNADYVGVKKNDIRYFAPDSIVWVPNMDITDYKMWITTPGNVENYEDAPNEMYSFHFQQDLEILIMASWWKEGSGVLAPGVRFNTEKELEESKRVYQRLFTNYPVTTLEDGQTLINGLDNTLFETSDNTSPTTISNISNFSRERVYKIICGGLENATSIKKEGVFSEIVSDYVPKAVGDYIKVYAQLHEVQKVVSGKSITIVEPTGKLLELERKVSN